MTHPLPTDETGNPIDLPAVLAAHRRWRETNGADGQFAYLCDADLRYADLRYADLRDADLRGANLRGADLCGASGCILLTETDHGYHVVAGFREGEWRIWAGCRDFTIQEAREHWGAPDYHTPLSGRRVVACLDWLEKEIANGLVIGGAE